MGTGTIASFNRQYRPFPEARAFVHTLNLKSSNEWREYCKSGQKPLDIPTMPERYGSDYKGMGDWLGTGNVAPTKRVWRPFAEARSYIRSLKLQDQDDWLVYRKSGKRPTDIPANPDVAYLAEFESYGDWVGNDNIHRGKITYRPFTEARTFVRALGLKSYKQWQEYCRSGKKPPDIPSDPRRRYPGEYKSIANWLGTEYLSFSEARAFVRTLGLKNHRDWRNYRRSSKKPRYIPSNPVQVYRTEYKGMKDWVGVVDKWNSDTLLTFLPAGVLYQLIFRNVLQYSLALLQAYGTLYEQCAATGLYPG